MVKGVEPQPVPLGVTVALPETPVVLMVKLTVSPAVTWPTSVRTLVWTAGLTRVMFWLACAGVRAFWVPVQVSVSVPAEPAEKVTVAELAPEVMAPPVMVQARLVELVEAQVALKPPR